MALKTLKAGMSESANGVGVGGPVPGGGATGQVLAKTSSADGAIAWTTVRADTSWADDAARVVKAADYAGQIGFQIDTGVFYWAISTGAGDWTNQFNMAVVGNQTAITGTGTLTSGATGAGFTVALTTSTVTGNLPDARNTVSNSTTTTMSALATIGGLTTVTGTGAMSFTGGAGNMTITSGTGNSRTLILQSTTSGGVATTFLTGLANQTGQFAKEVSIASGQALILNGATASSNSSADIFLNGNQLVLHNGTASGASATFAIVLGSAPVTAISGTGAGSGTIAIPGTLSVTGALTATGGATIGSGSSAILKVLTATATLDFGSTVLGSSTDLTITLTGAAVGDCVLLGVPNASVNANSDYFAWVSATNTVTVRFSNYSALTIDPASGSFRVSVVQF